VHTVFAYSFLKCVIFYDIGQIDKVTELPLLTRKGKYEKI